MRRSLGIIAAVLLLAAVGTACLLAGFVERRMAIAQEDMAVLDFVDPQADYIALEADLERFPWVSRGPLREIRQRRAMLQYWQGDYADLVEVARVASQATSGDEPIDPETQILAANALYRVAQRAPQDHPRLLRRLARRQRASRRRVQFRTGRQDA
jgi:hypothetical protein